MAATSNTARGTEPLYLLCPGPKPAALRALLDAWASYAALGGDPLHGTAADELAAVRGWKPHTEDVVRHLALIGAGDPKQRVSAATRVVVDAGGDPRRAVGGLLGIAPGEHGWGPGEVSWAEALGGGFATSKSWAEVADDLLVCALRALQARGDTLTSLARLCHRIGIAGPDIVAALVELAGHGAHLTIEHLVEEAVGLNPGGLGGPAGLR